MYRQTAQAEGLLEISRELSVSDTPGFAALSHVDPEGAAESYGDILARPSG